MRALMARIIDRLTTGRARNTARRDPAPSRTAYRLHRLWLTPLFRLALRITLPMLAVGLGSYAWLSEPARREALRDFVVETRYAFEHRPEFMVRLMRIDTLTDEVAEDIREVVPIDLPVSSFDLDLPALKAQIETLDAVARADLVVRRGVLEIRVVERIPAVVWRNGDTLELLDATGRRVKEIAARADRPDLPLIAGEGADRAVPEALAVLAAAEPILGRIRALVRIGERRWDLVLTERQRVLLPERGAEAAVERMLALDAAHGLLSRRLTIIDLRNPARPTVRLEDGVPMLTGVGGAPNRQGGDEI